jgi:hypothetical protein
MGLALIAVSLYAVSLSLQRDAARVEVARLKAEYVAADAQARRRALETEMRHAEKMQALAEKLTKELDDADETHRRTVDDLERGAVRLRAHWQGCIATGDLSRSAEAAARDDENARLRAEGAAAVVRAGAECDARLRGWQQYARSVMGE